MTKQILDWTKTTLGEVATLQKGMTITSKTARLGNVPVIAGGQKPAYFHAEANRPAKTITVSASGAYAGYVAFHTEPIWASDCTTIVPTDETTCTPEFLHYFLQSKQDEIYGLQRGSGMPHVYAKDLALLELGLPPLDVQNQIVEALDGHLSRLDKALAEVTSALQKFETLERSAMALHFETSADSAFVTVTKIADVTEKAKSIDPKSLVSEAFKYVDISSISPDSETPNVSEWTSTSAAPSRARQHIKSGDVVFSTVRPYQKKIAIVKDDLDGHIASTGFCVLRPVPGVLDTRYLFHYLKSDVLMDQVLPLQRGASYPAVGDSDVKNSTIPLPDLATQIAIAEELDSVVGIVKSLKSQLHDIAKTGDTMRRTILHSAFSGKLLEEK